MPKKKCKTFQFVVEGTPISQRAITDEEKTFWSSAKQKRLQYELTVLEQYEKQLNDIEPQNSPFEPKPIDGLISLTIHFFLAPKPMLMLSKLQDCPHSEAPRITDLARFVENTLARLVFTKACKIIKLKSDKTYAEKPKTIIKIKINEAGEHNAKPKT